MRVGTQEAQDPQTTGCKHQDRVDGFTTGDPARKDESRVTGSPSPWLDYPARTLWKGDRARS